MDFPFSNIKYTSEYTRAQLRKKKRKKNKKRKSEDEETNSSVVQGVCDVDGDAEEYVHTHYLNIDPISVTWSANGHHFQYLEKV